MDPRLVVRIPEAELFHHIQKEVGQIIYGVVSIPVDTAHDGGLDNEIAAVILAGAFR